VRRRAGGVGPLRAALLVALAASGPAARAQPARPERGQAYVADVGPGLAGRILRDVLARPHDVVFAPDTGLTFPRDTTFARTLLVIGGPTRVAAAVRGDLVVIGDLYLRPGARIDGRAVAYGGGAYNSTLAIVRGGLSAWPDVTFDARTDAATGAVALTYRALERQPVRLIALTGLYGFRIPTYTRVDGLALGFGPEVALRGGAVRLEPVVTYRTHIGAVDPSLRAITTLGRRTSFEALAARGTYTNDAWMRGDLVNSAVTLAFGGDARNYYRADRIEATVARRYEVANGEIEPFVGALAERSWSIARDSAAPAPFSALGRDDAREGIRRPNPAVSGGRVGSALLGARFRMESGGVTSRATLRAEVAPIAPEGRRFSQLTADGRFTFPAFRDHRAAVLAHAVATFSDATPSQRYAYLGGGPTLPSIALDSLGGDRLLWTETRYTVPVSAVSLPFVGSPSVTLRLMLGGAGVGRIGELTQNVGIRINAGPLRLDYTFDPTGAGEREFGVGFGFP
jgi:hypothetical protein